MRRAGKEEEQKDSEKQNQGPRIWKEHLGHGTGRTNFFPTCHSQPQTHIVGHAGAIVTAAEAEDAEELTDPPKLINLASQKGPAIKQLYCSSKPQGPAEHLQVQPPT